MHSRQTKLVAERGARALRSLRLIEGSIGTLNDEDLLDLADIFKGQPDAPLSDMASIEMTRRGISL